MLFLFSWIITWNVLSRLFPLDLRVKVKVIGGILYPLLRRNCFSGKVTLDVLLGESYFLGLGVNVIGLSHRAECRFLGKLHTSAYRTYPQLAATVQPAQDQFQEVR